MRRPPVILVALAAAAVAAGCDDGDESAFNVAPLADWATRQQAADKRAAKTLREDRACVGSEWYRRAIDGYRNAADNYNGWLTGVASAVDSGETPVTNTDSLRLGLQWSRILAVSAQMAEVTRSRYPGCQSSGSTTPTPTLPTPPPAATGSGGSPRPVLPHLPNPGGATTPGPQPQMRMVQAGGAGGTSGYVIAAQAAAAAAPAVVALLKYEDESQKASRSSKAAAVRELRWPELEQVVAP